MLVFFIFKPTFSILHGHFYKTPTSDYLLYTHFYLNIHFYSFFIIIFYLYFFSHVISHSHLSHVLSSLSSLLFRVQTTTKLPWLNLYSQNSNIATTKANLHGWASISFIYCCHCLLLLLLLIRCFHCFLFFFLATAIAAASSSSSWPLLLLWWFTYICIWVWWVWDLDLRKPYGFDELRSRSRICLMILMNCLDLMICIEEIEMEES